MGKRIWILGAAVLACTGALLSAPAAAGTSPIYHHYEPVPQRVWVPGHWEWQGDRHVWIHGQYVQGAYHGGRWARRGDRDRDGIPDRYDRDLDNDGVRNRHDRQPNNAYRY